ncbi:MAG: hypothetical protein ACXWLT_13105 [Rhizomicrobium sp.]
MQPRRFIVCLAVALLGPVSTVHAQGQSTPLFAAFKTYCLDAGADPDQVRMAVEVAGGKGHVREASTSSPWPMTMESWDILVQGHRMILTIGTEHPPHGADMVANTTNCTIYSYGGDESASMEALRKWAGVPRAPGVAFTEFYTFRQHGAAHLPVAKQYEHAAEDTGDLWQLTLIGKNSFQLTRTMTPTPKSH